MAVRKNAKSLTPAEREDFAHACVLMKADIVNPADPPADQFSVWEQFVALHYAIQNASTPASPGADSVNFGHGGLGRYGFLSWHRYYLYLFEQRLQSYVPGVLLPYWDWTDPIGTVLVDNFLGPNGDAGTGAVSQGYFGATAPGTGANTFPSPAWWPAGLAGWTMPAAFGIAAGALVRRTGAGSLPSATHLRNALNMSDLRAVQAALEGGTGGVGHGLHNSLHVWFGGGSHMTNASVSPFDPIFYMHHCNVDRLWAMWQMDGHATEFPDVVFTAGDPVDHLRDALMYPWVGATPGYSAILPGTVTLPAFPAVGAITHGDTLDHRALGYTYDSMPVIGIALDRTGSMNAMTPDPMTTGAPDVSKWEAAKRGVSAFLQDCEAVWNSGEAYVVAGVETFHSIPANEFTPVFTGTPYGVVKASGAYSQSTFDTNIAAVTADGGTPLADALLDTYNTLVVPPFGRIPPDEQRCLALFTDGLLTSGAALSTIPDGSLANTAVFAMGFGTAADVDYTTLESIAAKGVTLPTTQVFHGENAGTIDKFFTQALATALGFSTVLDPVLELYSGEHTHLDFSVTSADDAYMITAQGMDFRDENWTYLLFAPDGACMHGDAGGHVHGGGGGHVMRRPVVTFRRGKARLSLVLQRDSADTAAWVGDWNLVIAYRAKELDAMTMLNPAALMVPVAAGPTRGARYARLLQSVKARVPVRAVPGKMRHPLDTRPTSSNSGQGTASSVVVNIGARTRLRIELGTEAPALEAGKELAVHIGSNVLRGNVSDLRAFGRMVGPTHDLKALVARVKSADIPANARLKGSIIQTIDPAYLLAFLEKEKPELAHVRDEQLNLVSHHEGPLHAHVKDTEVPGGYHVGVYLTGSYCPDHASGAAGHDHDHEHAAAAGHDHGQEVPCCDADCRPERFMRILAVSAGVSSGKQKK